MHISTYKSTVLPFITNTLNFKVYLQVVIFMVVQSRTLREQSVEVTPLLLN